MYISATICQRWRMVLQLVAAAVLLSSAHEANTHQGPSQRAAPPLWLSYPKNLPSVTQNPSGSPGLKQSPSHVPATSGQSHALGAAPSIMLQRAAPIKHSLKLSSRNATTVRIQVHDLRAGTVHRAPLRNKGDQAQIKIKVPEGNEYLGVGVFARDLAPGANVDLSLEFQGEVITESANPAGVDEFVEAVDGLMPGEYLVRVKGSDVPRAFSARVYVWLVNQRKAQAEPALNLPIKVSPNPVQLTPTPGCCSIELSVSGLGPTESEPNRYIGLLRYQREDGTPLPGAAPTVMYLF